MNDENKTVTKITEPGSSSVLMKSRMDRGTNCAVTINIVWHRKL